MPRRFQVEMGFRSVKVKTHQESRDVDRFSTHQFCEDAYNQRQQTEAVSRRSVGSVGLGQAGQWRETARVDVNQGPGLPGRGVRR